MFRFVSFATLGVYWISLFIGTHVPHGVRGIGRVNDKLLHFGAYAGLAFLLAAALTSLRVKHGALLLPIVIAALYGCFDELSQLAVQGRHADIADWAADVFGAGVGVFAFGVLSLLVAKWFAKPQQSVPEHIRKSAA